MVLFGRYLLVALALSLVSCGGSSGGSGSTPTNPAPTTPTVSTVNVTGPSASAKMGETAQFTATAIMSNGSTQTVTGQATWQSSNTVVATVSSSGMVTAVGVGDADIRASFQSVTGSARMTVVSVATSLCGTVRSSTNNAGVGGAEIEILTGPNAGRKVTADSGGAFCFDGLQPGTITVRIRGANFNTSDQNVAVSGTTFVTLVLSPASSPSPTPNPPGPTPPGPTPPSPNPQPGPNGPTCNAAAYPSSASCGTPTAVCDNGQLSCSQNRSGTCSSNGGVRCWLCPGKLCNGLTTMQAPSFIFDPPLATENEAATPKR